MRESPPEFNDGLPLAGPAEITPGINQHVGSSEQLPQEDPMTPEGKRGLVMVIGGVFAVAAVAVGGYLASRFQDSGAEGGFISTTVDGCEIVGEPQAGRPTDNGDLESSIEIDPDNNRVTVRVRIGEVPDPESASPIFGTDQVPVADVEIFCTETIESEESGQGLPSESETGESDEGEAESPGQGEENSDDESGNGDQGGNGEDEESEGGTDIPNDPTSGNSNRETGGKFGGSDLPPRSSDSIDKSL